VPVRKLTSSREIADFLSSYGDGAHCRISN
jgi:hypothetical protein